MKVVIKSDALWYGTNRIGAASALYCYPGEQAHLGGDAGVVVCQTPARIDLLFTAGDRVVGCEVKRLEDLISSHRAHRLHRQLATLRSTVDVACLVVRGLGGDEGCMFDLSIVSAHPQPDVFWGDWLNWQTQGVYILPVPMADYLPRLLVYRRALATSGMRALAGTDIRPPRERARGWLLRRIPGIGPDKSARLINLYGSSMGALVAAQNGDVGLTLGKAVEEKLCQAATT